MVNYGKIVISKGGEMIVKEQDLIKYLNYIGITKKTHQKKIVSVYKKGVRVSEFRKIIGELNYEEDCLDKILSYLMFPQYRGDMDKEISKALKEKKGVWGK